MKWSLLEACGLRAKRPAEQNDLTTCVEGRHPNCAVTASGRMINLLAIDDADIDIHDIAHHLSQENRYCGACIHPYSVAQHCVLCAAECLRRYPNRHDLALACLLHDASEYLLKDIPRTVKRLIEYCYRPHEARLQKAIWRKFNVIVTPGTTSG